MKSYSIYSFSFIVLIVMLMGCSTFLINSNDFATLQSGTPLINIKARTFALKEFRDVRETKDPLLLPNVACRLDQPPAIVVRTTIKKELERNGHLCIDYSPEAKADFIIGGVVYKHSVIFDNGVRAIVAVKLSVSKFSNDKTIFTKTYEGEYQGSSLGKWLPNVVTDFLSAAYLAMVKEMATDADLLEFLEK